MSQLFHTKVPVERVKGKGKPEKHENVVLMYSGGLDSLVAYYHLKKLLGKPPMIVYAGIHHRYMAKELCAIKNISKLTRGEIDPIIDKTLNLGKWEEENANIPQRNMFLAMVGAYYGDEVHLVCQKGEQDIPDRSPEFFHSASGMISFLMGKKISIHATFPNNTKTDMVKWYKDNQLDLEVLKMSVSCYSPMGGKCGNCSSCFRRWVAMSINGIHEHYEKEPWKWDGVPSYVERIKNGQIDISRVEDIKMALQMKGVEF